MHRGNQGLLIACQIHFGSHVRLRHETSSSLLRASRSLIWPSCLRSGCSRANRIANKCPTEYPYVFFCSILLIIPTFWVSDRTEMVHITSHIDSRYCIDATAHLDIFPIICAVWYNYYVASSTVFLPKSIHKCICHNINCLDDVSPLCITKYHCGELLWHHVECRYLILSTNRWITI